MKGSTARPTIDPLLLTNGSDHLESIHIWPVHIEEHEIVAVTLRRFLVEARQNHERALPQFARIRAPRSLTSSTRSVEHGVLLVRSELIQDRVQRLTAGQSLSIRAGEALPPPANGDQSFAAPVKTAPMASSLEHASAAPSLEQLLTRADERRRLGDVSGAESALRLALSAHGNEPQAALAAFTLGKLLSDVAGRPEAAAEAFARCLALSPPSALAEDALYRLAEAQANAGNASAARASAQNYRARYPNGRHIDALNRWLGEH